MRNMYSALCSAFVVGMVSCIAFLHLFSSTGVWWIALITGAVAAWNLFFMVYSIKAVKKEIETDVDLKVSEQILDILEEAAEKAGYQSTTSDSTVEETEVENAEHS